MGYLEGGLVCPSLCKRNSSAGVTNIYAANFSLLIYLLCKRNSLDKLVHFSLLVYLLYKRNSLAGFDYETNGIPFGS